MFVRILTMAVKPGHGAELARVIEQKHIPVLKRFAGYRDQISMLSQGGKHATLMSFWDSAADAEVYARDGYPEVLEATESLINSKPVVATYEMIFSTVHHMHAVGV